MTNAISGLSNVVCENPERFPRKRILVKVHSGRQIMICTGEAVNRLRGYDERSSIIPYPLDVTIICRDDLKSMCIGHRSCSFPVMQTFPESLLLVDVGIGFRFYSTRRKSNLRLENTGPIGKQAPSHWSSWQDMAGL